VILNLPCKLTFTKQYRVIIYLNLFFLTAEDGKNMGVVAHGRSTLFIKEVAIEDIDTYKCVIKVNRQHLFYKMIITSHLPSNLFRYLKPCFQDCCSNKKSTEYTIDIKVPDDTCADAYGSGSLIFAAVWSV